MNIGKKEITVAASVLALILTVWNFGDRLIGESGLIATNRGVEYKHQQVLEQISDLAVKVEQNSIEPKKIYLTIIKKEINYTRKRCGIKPLEGDCLKDNEKLYYVDLLEQRKELKEDIKKLEEK